MYKRGGIWWTCIKYNGRKIQKSLETSDKKLAKDIEAKIRTEIVEGKYFDKPKGESITVKVLIDKYLTEHSKPTKQKRSHQEDIYLSKKIINYFGNKFITEVSPKTISDFIKIRRDDNLSDTTINHELRLLKHAYSLAIREWEMINISPFDKVKIPKGDVKRVRYLSDDEEINLMKVLPEWLEPIVTIARETGLRLSDIVNLKWHQVNLFNKTIFIETSKNGDPLGLPMTENVLSVFKNLSKVKSINLNYIFSKDGRPFLRERVSRAFRKACIQANIKNFRFHDLRHDFCSRLVQSGVELYTVAKLAGHRDIKTTQRYAHLSPETLRSAMDIFNSDYNLTTIRENQMRKGMLTN